MIKTHVSKSNLDQKAKCRKTFIKTVFLIIIALNICPVIHVCLMCYVAGSFLPKILSSFFGANLTFSILENSTDWISMKC